MLSTDECYVLISAVRYQLPRRTYGSSIISNYIVNNINNIDIITLEDIARDIQKALDSREVPSVDVPEWLRALDRITEYFNKG